MSKSHMGLKRPHKFIARGTVDYVFKRDNGTCVYCGDHAQEIDHVIPTTDGGNSVKSNLVCVCKKCNTKKAHHIDDPKWLTMSIIWLAQKGEDISWMDDVYK